MAWEEVTEGYWFNLYNLSQYEDQLPEGSKNLLQLNLRLPVSEDVAIDLENVLRGAGVEDVKVTTASPVLRIYFTKGFPWLAVIAAAILASIILASLVVGWKLFTYVGEVAPEAIPLLALAGIGLLVIVGIAVVKMK